MSTVTSMTRLRARVKRTHPAAPEQPADPCDPRVMALLRELLADERPPDALVGRALAAKRHLCEVGRHAEGLKELSRAGVGLIEATSILAATTPGHDPFDADAMLYRDADGTDPCVALGLLLRVKRSAGQALDLACTGYLIDDDDCWRGIHHGHAVTAATDLLHAAMRRWPECVREVVR